MKKWFAASELLFATVIWGFGFTATIWALESVDPISLNFLRFGLAALIGLGISWIAPRLRQDITWEQFKLAFIPGLLIGLAIALQTWGLVFTTATNSGFITTLYVVIVPICELLILRRRIHILHSLWVMLALAGTALIVNLELANINKGDVLTLICAFFAALQIIAIGAIYKSIKSSFVFNTFQSFWAALISLPLFFFVEEVRWSAPSALALLGLFSLTIGSSLLAFALQIRAQKVLSPSLSSLIFLLESPFAVVFAVLLLNESLTTFKIIGALVIIAAALGATVTETRTRARN